MVLQQDVHTVVVGIQGCCTAGGGWWEGTDCNVVPDIPGLQVEHCKMVGAGCKSTAVSILHTVEVDMKPVLGGHNVDLLEQNQYAAADMMVLKAKDHKSLENYYTVEADQERQIL